MSKSNSPNPTSLANNLVHTGTGDINYSNYVEPVGHTPCDDLQINSRNDGDYIPLPHQDQPDESTDSESNTSYTSTAAKQPQPALKTKISLKESNQIQATGPYQVPAFVNNLKYPSRQTHKLLPQTQKPFHSRL